MRELRAMLRDQLGLSLSPAAQTLEAQIADDPSLLRSRMRAPLKDAGAAGTDAADRSGR